MFDFGKTVLLQNLEKEEKPFMSRLRPENPDTLVEKTTNCVFR